MRHLVLAEYYKSSLDGRGEILRVDVLRQRRTDGERRIGKITAMRRLRRLLNVRQEHRNVRIAVGSGIVAQRAEARVAALRTRHDELGAARDGNEDIGHRLDRAGSF